MNNRRSFMALAILCLALPAGAGEAVVAAVPRMSVTDGWARATPPGMNLSSAYLVITNRGSRSDVLLGASSSVARGVEVHRTVMEGGMSRMRPAGPLAIAPGATLRIEPNGLHLMLVGLAIPLLEGKTVPLALHFRDAGTLTVQLPIRPLGATAAHHGH